MSIVVSEHIFFWTRHGKYGYCSNFHRSPVTMNGREYATVEHWYQASKTVNILDHEMIRALPTPKEAKFAGYHVVLRPGWDAMKLGVMLEGLRAKFIQHPDLGKKLLSTGNASLHENSPWDNYWGYVGGNGQDMLGKLLMQVRKELQ